MERLEKMLCAAFIAMTPEYVTGRDAMASGIKTWPQPSGGYNAANDFIDRNVTEGRGDKIAFVDPTRTLTYRELQARCNRFANALPRLGIGRERRIMMIMLDTVEFPAVFWGAIKAGVVPIPINTLLTLEQWQYMIEDSRADAVVISAALLDRARPVLDAISARRHLHVIVTDGAAGPNDIGIDSLLVNSADEAESAATHADETAFWLYSSGSTGNPKGTRHVHSSPYWSALSYGVGVLGITPDDVGFSVAKLFFAYGLGNSMNFPMSVGATTILSPDRQTPDTVLATMRQHNPTIFYCVPTLYASMLAHPQIERGAGSNRLRLCLAAGEALPGDVGKRWEEKVGMEILDGLGSTEMLHIFCSNRSGKVRYGSSGKPVANYEAKLVDDDGQVLGPGEIGEMLVKGPTAAEGYWNQRDRSRRTFAGEWTRTGDKYRVDDDGYYYCCGRTDDMFKVSGIWVSPFEVESALITHASVLEAAVIGVEDTDGLLKPKAYIVLKPGQAAGENLVEDLKAHVKAAAGPWKYPRWIEVRSELPKTATGKIQRFKLRAEGQASG
jgi:4-hydroxybenzoate-CoA ligase